MLPEAGSSTARTRTRLTPAGAAFLANYARTVNSYPQKTEKESILDTLHAIPGNQDFTLKKLSSWFARNRNPSGDPPTAILLDDETILFPKLTPTHLQQLRVLYRKRSDPSDGIITFWADRLKVERTEVVAWIQYQQEKAKENDVGATPESPEIPSQHLVCDSASVSPIASEFPRPHLPTPAMSPISPHTRVPSLPPIAVKVEEHRQSLSTSLFKPRPDNYSPLGGLPPLSRAHTTPVATSVPSNMLHVGDRRASNAMLTASIRDSLRLSESPTEQLPRTVDEFAEKFERVENMIQAFMSKYESGQLGRLGWDSSLCSATRS